jgi:hypothetical protein
MIGTHWFYSQPGFHKPAPKPVYRCAVCGDAVKESQIVCMGDRDADGPAVDAAIDRERARRKQEAQLTAAGE